MAVRVKTGKDALFSEKDKLEQQVNIAFVKASTKTIRYVSWWSCETSPPELKWRVDITTRVPQSRFGVDKVITDGKRVKGFRWWFFGGTVVYDPIITLPHPFGGSWYNSLQGEVSPPIYVVIYYRVILITKLLLRKKI